MGFAGACFAVIRFMGSAARDLLGNSGDGGLGIARVGPELWAGRELWAGPELW